MNQWSIKNAQKKIPMILVAGKVCLVAESEFHANCDLSFIPRVYSAKKMSALNKFKVF